MTRTAADPTLKFIRETCADLDTKYDREAVKLICSVGIFAVDDPAELGNAVERLQGKSQDLERILALQTQAREGATADVRQTAISELDDFRFNQQTEAIEVAYLLGIAVGRRIGSASLRLTGGAR